MKQGLHTNRFSSNPLEKAFADEWNEKNTFERVLEYLLSIDNVPRETSDEAQEVASTVIQWLGSSVGLSFVTKVLNDNDFIVAPKDYLNPPPAITTQKYKAMLQWKDANKS